MSNKKLECIVCGSKYDGCISCERNSLTSWKTVCDTENHFTIFTILHKYNVTKKITKEQAKELLLKCDLTGWENFQIGIASSIAKILKEKTPIKEEVKEIKPIGEAIEKPVVDIIKNPMITTEIIKPTKKQYNKNNTEK